MEEIGVCEANHHWRSEYTRTSKSGKVSVVPGGCVANPGYGVKKSPEYKEFEGMPAGRVSPKSPRRRSPSPVPKDGSCPAGYQYRRGHTDKNGVEVRSSCVDVNDNATMGLPPGPKLPAKEGELSQFGYSTKLSPEERYATLDAAALDVSALSAFRHLNVRATQLKNTAPEASDIMKSDMNYLSLLDKLSAPDVRSGKMIPYVWELPTQIRRDILAWVIYKTNLNDTLNLLNSLSTYWSTNTIASSKIKSDIQSISQP